MEPTQESHSRPELQSPHLCVGEVRGLCEDDELMSVKSQPHGLEHLDAQPLSALLAAGKGLGRESGDDDKPCEPSLSGVGNREDR